MFADDTPEYYNNLVKQALSVKAKIARIVSLLQQAITESNRIDSTNLDFDGGYLDQALSDMYDQMSDITDYVREAREEEAYFRKK